jgi:hypothetical protein
VEDNLKSAKSFFLSQSTSLYEIDSSSACIFSSGLRHSEALAGVHTGSPEQISLVRGDWVVVAGMFMCEMSLQLLGRPVLIFLTSSQPPG